MWDNYRWMTCHRKEKAASSLMTSVGTIVCIVFVIIVDSSTSRNCRRPRSFIHGHRHRRATALAVPLIYCFASSCANLPYRPPQLAGFAATDSLTKVMSRCLLDAGQKPSSKTPNQRRADASGAAADRRYR